MIDSHSHTFYSKHAVGTVDELVRASIAAGVKILTITDHAPFPVDSNNRLLEAELECYFADIERARQEHQGKIKILRGLEFDYMPGADAYNREMLARYELDFAIVEGKKEFFERWFATEEANWFRLCDDCQELGNGTLNIAAQKVIVHFNI